MVSYRNDGTLTNQTTYYLTNLTSASSTTKGKWKQEYTFTHQWKNTDPKRGELEQHL